MEAGAAVQAGADHVRRRWIGTWPTLALAASLTAIYVIAALSRLVDGDEGFYLMAARLAFGGQLPYYDFHYPMMPALPYVYGAWMAVFGESWYVARTLSALVSVALCLIMARHVERLTGRQWFGIGAALVLALSGLGLVWYTTVKTLALATLLVFGAYVVVEERRAAYSPLIAGLLIALAADVRLYLIGLAPILAIGVFRRAAPGSAHRDLAAFSLGVVTGVIPALAFAWPDLDVFWFNIVGVHGIRSDWGFAGNLSRKFAGIQSAIGISLPDGGSAVQLWILLVMNVALYVIATAAREKVPLSLLAGSALLVLSFLPTPFYAQYMSIVLPFPVVGAAFLIHRIALDTEEAPALARRLRQGGVVLAVAYVLLTPAEIYRYTVTGYGVEGVQPPAGADSWRISHVVAVGRVVDSLATGSPTEVISFWPGFFIGTRATVAPGFENQFTVWWADRLSPEQRERYRFMSWPRVWYHITNRHFPVVVIGNINYPLADNAWDELVKLLVESGYVHVRTMADTKIYAIK